MISILSNQKENNDQFYKDFDDLLCNKRRGHMGHWEYNNQSMSLWNKFLKENANYYYIPKNEIQLIQQYSYLSASLLVNDPITFVSRGPGTLFHKKEAELLKQIRNVNSIIYIDSCQAALDVSVMDGKKLHPKIKHHVVRDDFYDPKLSYPVAGKQLNVCFGLTFLNIEADPEQYNPETAFVEKMKGLRKQLSKGDQLITVLDHTQNTAILERAYSRQGPFAKAMLTKYDCLDQTLVDFCVKHFPESNILAHGYRFKRDYLLQTSQGGKVFHKGDVLWFNNSLKPPLEQAKAWMEKAGFRYLLQHVPLDAQERLGWHHVEAI